MNVRMTVSIVLKDRAISPLHAGSELERALQQLDHLSKLVKMLVEENKTRKAENETIMTSLDRHLLETKDNVPTHSSKLFYVQKFV